MRNHGAWRTRWPRGLAVGTTDLTLPYRDGFQLNCDASASVLRDHLLLTGRA
jgi:hypothetical protein